MKKYIFPITILVLSVLSAPLVWYLGPEIETPRKLVLCLLLGFLITCSGMVAGYKPFTDE